MDNVTFSFCHLYPMYRFLLSCHNKRPSYDHFDFIIEEPFDHIFTEKVSHFLGAVLLLGQGGQLCYSVQLTHDKRY